MNEWLQLTDLSNNDDLDAATVPSCDSDLTQFQAEVLRKNEDANSSWHYDWQLLHFRLE